MKRILLITMILLMVALTGCSEKQSYVTMTQEPSQESTTSVSTSERHVIVSDDIYSEYGPRTFIHVSVVIFDGSEHNYMSFYRQPVIETLPSTSGTVLSKYSKDDEGNVIMRYMTSGMWVSKQEWTTGFNNYGFSITNNGNGSITLTMTMADDTGYPGSDYVTAMTRSVTVPVGWVTINVSVSDKGLILE